MAGNLDKVMKNLKKSQKLKAKEELIEDEEEEVEEDDEEEAEDEDDEEDEEEEAEDDIPVKKPIKKKVKKDNSQVVTSKSSNDAEESAKYITLLQNDGLYRAELLHRLDILNSLVKQLVGGEEDGK